MNENVPSSHVSRHAPPEASARVIARQCTAHNRSGARCKKSAMRWQRICHFHGGKSPKALASARQRALEAVEPVCVELDQLGMAAFASDSQRFNRVLRALDRIEKVDARLEQRYGLPLSTIEGERTSELEDFPPGNQTGPAVYKSPRAARRADALSNDLSPGRVSTGTVDAANGAGMSNPPANGNGGPGGPFRAVDPRPTPRDASTDPDSDPEWVEV